MNFLQRGGEDGNEAVFVYGYKYLLGHERGRSDRTHLLQGTEVSNDSARYIAIVKSQIYSSLY